MDFLRDGVEVVEIPFLVEFKARWLKEELKAPATNYRL